MKKVGRAGWSGRQWFLGGAAALFLWTAPCARAEEPVSGELLSPYKTGLPQGPTWSFVWLRVRTGAAGFQGEAVIEPDRDPADRAPRSTASARVALAVAPDATALIPAVLPRGLFGWNVAAVRARFEDRAGREVARTPASGFVITPDSSAVSVLALSGQGSLGALDLNAAGRTIPVWHLSSPELFPPLVEGLDWCEVVLLDGADPSSWQPAQRAALAAWVRRGGHLLVTPREAAQMQADWGGLALPASLGRTHTVFEPAPPDQPGVARRGLIAWEFRPFPGAQTLASRPDSDEPWIVGHRQGRGSVSLCAVSWRVLAEHDTARAAELFRRWLGGLAALGLGASRPVSALSAANLNALVVAQCGADGAFTSEHFAWITGLLGAYMLLVSPVTFFVLRRWGRREWALITTPVLVAALCLVFHFFGVIVKGTDTRVNTLTLVELGPGDEHADLRTLATVFSAVADSATLALATPDASWTDPESFTEGLPISAGPGQTVLDGATVRTDGTRLVLADGPLAPWVPAALATRRVADCGRFRFEGRFTAAGLEGELTNGTRWAPRAVLLLTRRGVWTLPAAAPGARERFARAAAERVGDAAALLAPQVGAERWALARDHEPSWSSWAWQRHAEAIVLRDTAAGEGAVLAALVEEDLSGIDWPAAWTRRRHLTLMLQAETVAGRPELSWAPAVLSLAATPHRVRWTGDVTPAETEVPSWAGDRRRMVRGWSMTEDTVYGLEIDCSDYDPAELARAWAELRVVRYETYDVTNQVLIGGPGDEAPVADGGWQYLPPGTLAGRLDADRRLRLQLADPGGGALSDVALRVGTGAR